MPIVAAIAVPHPPLILPPIGRGEERGIQRTIDAFGETSRFLARANPQTVVIISPHATLFSDWFEISPEAAAQGSFAAYGAPELRFAVEYDEPLARRIASLAQNRGIPAGPSGRGEAALDHATMIPLHFLNQALDGYRVVRIGLSGLPPAMHRELGRCIAEASGEQRVAVVGSGDLSHRLKEDGPYGFRPEGPELDEAITGALGRGDFDALLDIDPRLAEAGAECGLRAFLMMGGAMGPGADARLLSYEGPFGVGYAVATFSPAGQCAAPPEPNDPCVALARLSLTHYVTTGERAPLPQGLPAELTERRAGAFVSLHRQGALRGCIGTISASAPSLAAEIMQNAVSAAVEDPRFPPVRPDELPGLTISVDVLGPAEPVSSISQLDPARYGVIVSSGHRRGLLLPCLEGVDTTAQQVDIARQKAGIPPGTPLQLERFEVVRHGSH